VAVKKNDASRSFQREQREDGKVDEGKEGSYAASAAEKTPIG